MTPTNPGGLFVASYAINKANEMTEDRKQDEPPPQRTDKEESKAHDKLLFIGAIVAAGAVLLASKFKGKLPKNPDGGIVIP